MATIKIDLPVYTFDIDSNNHVSNIVYIKWMEIGRLKLLEVAKMPISVIQEKGFGPLLVDTMISYKKPLYLSDSVSAEIWLSEMSRASAWIEFRFYNGKGDLVATGRQRGLFINYKTGKPYRITEAERAGFEPYLIPESQT